MKDKFHIDHIRILLHKYYEGETTPEEELLLEAFFRDTPGCEISEDLATDGRIFTSLASFHPDASDMETPEYLFEKISDISFSNAARHKDKIQRNRPIRIAYILATACACLILILGIRKMTAPTEIPTKTFEYAYEAPTQLPEKPSEASPKNQTIPEASNTPNVSVAVAHHSGNAIAENVDQPNRLEDGFIEITDPEEAERIVMEIGRLLASNTQKTNEAILHLEKTVDEYKEITKSILR